jgi:hypothetical protein
VDYYPFAVFTEVGIATDVPFSTHLSADFTWPHLSIYKALLDKYGLNRGEFYLIELAFISIDCNTDNLLDFMLITEDGYLLNASIADDLALEEFRTAVCPIFRDIRELELYLRRTTGL